MHRVPLLAVLVLVVDVAHAAPISVRYAEGVTRGYMLLRDTHGKILANGDLIQVAKGDAIEKRMTFRFKDGSLYDERVTDKDHEVFRLEKYELAQHGPAFDHDLEVSLTAAG